MIEDYASVAGEKATTVTLSVPNQGPWFADVDFAESPAIAGRVAGKLGALAFSGTIAPASDGTFGLQRKTRIVAGAGGWSKSVAEKDYHNDARVKARTVAEDAARQVGETIGGFVPTAERVAKDYVRQHGPASQALEDAIAGATWWVDFDGVTQVGTRPTSTPAPDAYEVLAYDPRSRVVTLAVDDLTKVGIGSVLTERLDAPQTIRDMTIYVTAEEVRVHAWCGESAAAGSREAALIRAIVERISGRKLFGKYRYRVVQMASDRVNLQSVRKAPGLPDVLYVDMWPGVAGAHARLTAGAEVLVEFVAGDRSDPVITHFAGKGGVGHVPVELVLCGSSLRGARQGDMTQSGGPGTQIVLIGPGAPAPVSTNTPYLVSFGVPTPPLMPQVPLYGAVATGSPKVKL